MGYGIFLRSAGDGKGSELEGTLSFVENAKTAPKESHGLSARRKRRENLPTAFWLLLTFSKPSSAQH
jgi:hypothetical protein